MADFHASTRTPSTFVISITPFDSSERVDEESLRQHARCRGPMQALPKCPLEIV